MSDYYTVGQLALKLGLDEGQAQDLLARASFVPVVKNGRKYYRSRNLHQLQAALRLSHQKGTSLEEALQAVLARVAQMRAGVA